MTNEVDEEFVQRLRQTIYTTFAEGGVPTAPELAMLLNQPVDLVRQAFQRLATQRALVLQANGGEILMAEPFSAVPTTFLIRSGTAQWWGNCIWDGLGVTAMLRLDAEVITVCQCCWTRLAIGIEQGERVASGSGVAHFLVPARHWWDRVVFT